MCGDLTPAPRAAPMAYCGPPVMEAAQVSESSGPLTVEQLLELHPWPAPWGGEKRIERLWVYDVPGTPEALWPFIADTSRMNRALGTAEMTFVGARRQALRHGAGRRRAPRVARGAVELGRRTSG